MGGKQGLKCKKIKLGGLLGSGAKAGQSGRPRSEKAWGAETGPGAEWCRIRGADREKSD